MVTPMMNLLLQGIVGSQAYGLATPDSDHDRLGVFQSRTSEVLGLHPPKETVTTHEPSDVALHEVGKFARLCLANNPTVMELLWLNEYEVMTPAGRSLVAIREEFLSQRVRNTYGGYARQQYERLLRREEGEAGAGFSSDLKKRTEKHGRHCFRLILQGTHILCYGSLRVRLGDAEVQKCRDAGRLAATDVVEFGKMVEQAMAEFDSTPSDLPLVPDESVVEELLIELRWEDFMIEQLCKIPLGSEDGS